MRSTPQFVKAAKQCDTWEGDLTAQLKTLFRLDTFKPGQEQVVRQVLGGRNSIAIFPTGGGKSLCYQLPAQLLAGLTLVVSPLLSLMKDQVDSLMRRGLPAASFDHNNTSDEIAKTWHRITTGDTKILFVAPERFLNESFIHHLHSVRVSLVAVDEAHCISQWGARFRPAYLRLRKAIRHYCPNATFLGLTATGAR